MIRLKQVIEEEIRKWRFQGHKENIIYWAFLCELYSQVSLLTVNFSPIDKTDIWKYYTIRSRLNTEEKRKLQKMEEKMIFKIQDEQYWEELIGKLQVAINKQLSWR